MGHRDPQIRQIIVFQTQPVEFRDAQEAFRLTDTYEEIAKRAVSTYTNNLMSMWAALQAARAKEQTSGTETRQEVQPEVRGRAHHCEAGSGDS